MPNFAQIVYDFFKGMSSFIAPEKLPKTVLELIENYELTLEYGNLRKRRGYEDLFTSGITDINFMVEFLDAGGNQILFVGDNYTLKESIYSSGYGTLDAIDNDELESGRAIIDTIPVKFNNEIRFASGSDFYDTFPNPDYIPFIFQYIKERDRFNGDVTISADRYALPRFNDNIADLSLTGDLVQTDYTTDMGADTAADQGFYVFWVSAILDGYIKCIPQPLSKNPAAIGINDPEYIHYISGADGGSIMELLTIPTASGELAKRVTGFNVFVSKIDDNKKSQFRDFPAYFLGKVDLDEDGEVIAILAGDTDTGGTITLPTASTWRTFNPVGCFVYNADQDEYYRITSLSSGVIYNVSPVPSASQVGDELRISPRWFDNGGGDYQYYIMYDDYYKRLGSEMFTYLNIPSGDQGLDYYQHTDGIIVNNRYIGINFYPDGWCYYSPPNAYDVLCSQNIIRPIAEIKGRAQAGRDVYIFYKTGASRITILSNTVIDQDDSAFDIGLVHRKALFQIDEDTFAFMSYGGPYLIQGRQKHNIGQDIKTWFNHVEGKPYFTNAQKEACVVGYNHLKEMVYFSFPTYSTSPYTNGIIFVFDMKAFRLGFQPWTVLKTDTPVYSFTLSEDAHCIAASTTKIVDLDGTSPDETVSTRLIFNLLKSASDRAKTLFHRLFLDITTDDTVTINAYYDESASATALTALNADGETKIGQLKKSMKLEITTAASANDVEVVRMKLLALPRRY